jgi:hypothetical protein
MRERKAEQHFLDAMYAQSERVFVRLSLSNSSKSLSKLKMNAPDHERRLEAMLQGRLAPVKTFRIHEAGPQKLNREPSASTELMRPTP